MKKRYIVPVVIGALLASGVALATNGNNNNDNKDHQDKVTICHRTDSATNPYVEITVDKDGLNGHDGHTGPLATSQEAAQKLKDAKTKWGDIIPGVLNDTDAGKAILANHCVVPEKEPVTPPVTTPGSGSGGDQTTAPTSAPTELPATGASY